MEPRPIVAIAIAAEDAAPPTIPDYGGAITYSGAWTVAPFNLGEEAINPVAVEEDSVVIRPPLKPNKTAKLHYAAGIDRIEFSTYDIGAAILEWASNFDEDDGEYTEQTARTRKACVIEYGGVGIIYMPSVEISSGPPADGAVKALAKHACVIDVFGTDDYPGGYAWLDFNEPGP